MVDQETINFSKDLSIGDILLINYLTECSYIRNSYPKYFYYDYNVDASKEVEYLINNRYIESVQTKELLSYLKADQLKEILRNYSLPVSGNKAALVKKIIENIGEDIYEPYINVKKYLLTQLGKDILEKYSLLVWAHKNKDITHLYPSEFVEYTSSNEMPESIAISIIENKIKKYLENGDFGLVRNCFFSIGSTLKNKGDSTNLYYFLTTFCFDISGLSNGSKTVVKLSDIPFFAPGLIDEIKDAKRSMSKRVLYKKFIEFWNIAIKAFPDYLPKKSEDALQLFKYAYNFNEEKFNELWDKLYNKYEIES